jgi:hypothetical protein
LDPMRPRLASAALLILCSCGIGGQSEPVAERPAAETWPLVVLLVDEGLESSPAVPWNLSEGRERISIGMVARAQADSPGPPTERLLREALDAGMLVALVEAGSLPGDLDREHIQIWTDSSGAPVSIPAEIAVSIPDSAWTHPVQRQAILRDIFDLYLPDLAVIRIQTQDITELHHIAFFWTDPEVLSSRNVILYAPSSGADSRGWALVGGPAVNGEIPMGLTPENLLSTMELMMGLDWEAGIPSRVPSVGILQGLAGGTASS